MSIKEFMRSQADPVSWDIAKRIADEMTAHAFMHSEGWVTFWLQDGRPFDKGTCYPTLADAIRCARLNRDHLVYIEAVPDGMTPFEALAHLKYWRQLHASGFRIPSEEFSFDASMPFLKSDRAKQVRHLASGGRHFPLGH